MSLFLPQWNLETLIQKPPMIKNSAIVSFIHFSAFFYMWNPFFFFFTKFAHFVFWDCHRMHLEFSQMKLWEQTSAEEGLEFISFVFVMGKESWRDVGNCLTPLYSIMKTCPFSVHPLCLNFLVWVSLTNSKQWEERYGKKDSPLPHPCHPFRD